MLLFHDQVFGAIHKLLHFMSRISPQQINHILTIFIDLFNCFLCKFFPPFFLMTITFTRFNSQYCVQKKDSLSRPLSKVSMQWIWWLECNLIIIFKGFVNIFQAWWHFNTFIYWKTHSHRFTGLDIWVLTANYNFYIFKTWLFVSIKNLVLGRETYLALIIIFFLHIIVKSFESWTLNVSLQRNFPVSKLILERFKSFEYIFTSILIFRSLMTNFFFFIWFFRGND